MSQKEIVEAFVALMDSYGQKFLEEEWKGIPEDERSFDWYIDSYGRVIFNLDVEAACDCCDFNSVSRDFEGLDEFLKFLTKSEEDPKKV